MKYRLIIATTVFAVAALTPAVAQTGGTAASGATSKVIKIELKGPNPSPAAGLSSVGAPAAIAPEGTGKARFGCDARRPAVCHFRIHYARGSRNVVLPAGMKQAIPGVAIDRDTYCVDVDKKPAPKCVRKTITAKYNS